MLLASLSTMAALQPVSEAPLALETDVDCRFNQDNSRDCITTYRYTILRPAGREALSRIDFDYALNDSFTVEKAELVQPGKEAVALSASNIDTRMAPNPDQGFSSGKRTSLAFPNLQVGSVVSYTIRERHLAAPLQSEFHGEQVFRATPVRFDRVMVRYSAVRPIVWRSEGMEDFSIEASEDKKELILRLKAPFYRSYINDVYERRFPRIELGSSISLQDNFGPFAKRYNEILAAPLPARAMQAVLSVRDQSPTQRVAALMEYIGQNFRYLGDWRASENGFVPFALEQIDARGYGDCKDLAILLTAMLRASGIKAEPALVARGVIAATLLLPTVNAPNHAIVRAEVDGKTLWLDPTNSVYLPGYIMPDLQDRWAFIFDGQGEVRQASVALPAPGLSQEVHSEEHFIKEGQSQIVSKVQLGSDSLTSLGRQEREQGMSSVNQVLCNAFAHVASDCVLRRGTLGFVLPSAYAIAVRVNDLESLRKVGDSYLYSRPAYEQRWDAYTLYRRNGQLLDMYIGPPGEISHIRTLTGGEIAARIQECKISSPWFDVSLASFSVPGGLRFHYQEVQKISWLTHTEINSDQFKEMLGKVRNCAGQLSLKIELLK